MTWLGAVLGAGRSLDARAQSPSVWPDRPVRIVSPLGPGGSNDISARILAERLQQRTRVPFFVENRPGATTRIGNEFVVHAPADGTTLLYGSAALAVLPTLSPRLPYDWRRDLVPVTLAVSVPLFLVVAGELPARDLAEFAALARTRPQGVTFAGPGVATVPHLVTELLIRKLGIVGRTVHFRGDAAATVELLAGRVDATFTAVTAALPFVQQGKLRVLGVAADTRHAVYPPAPTFAEQGVNGVVGSAWFGFLAPGRTPPALVARMHETIGGVLAEPAVRERLARSGQHAVGSPPDDFAAFIDSEVRKWEAVIKDAQIKGE